MWNDFARLPGRCRATLRLGALLCLLLPFTGCASSQKPYEAPASSYIAGQSQPGQPARHIRKAAPELAATLDPRTQHKPSYAAMAPAIQESLKYLASKKPGDVAAMAGTTSITWGQLVRTNQELLALLPALDQNKSLLLQRFQWLELAPGTLMTGYYEPLVEASPTPRPDYPWPIYKAPPNLKSSIWPTRNAIDFQGALKGRRLELAWAKDLIDVFFLHIQGSGRLRYPDGSMRNVLYAGSNGHPYYAVGRALIEQGYATKEEMSMQTIRRLFKEHPHKVQEWMSLNAKYIFYRLDDGPVSDPVGAMGRPLMPRVSAAVNRDTVPLGSILALDALLPGYQSPRPEPFSGIVLAQDTGTMRPNHFDLFMGFGEQAADQAGRMQQEATAYLLLAR
ncbi:MltA domain-containing protein [Megalodesulfovibrio gigas]|uniref:peptidoglycan lytic exotransglycosylase n=1 Tax=Megalodesulfovibrio gigas (strain ATCC 19364 / DSM 1382 / NCIMB 9332 / VKM B-1759) TaxID=1121448 RepID=T2GFU4_MEGG1|nr:MltA domain-containing protein [Megalodesulfovibrio gigas]AGW14817.1 putative membrane-bound lytic murein transglycosylase [Megalodesulfovibrio gigas DSM 1382 = ATCC 19364]